MSRTPNFFLVGAPKCGTTSLSEYLREHPNVFMCRPKEPHFFASDIYDRNPAGIETLESYLALFSRAQTDHVVVGEASASYLFSRTAARAIRELESEAKIVAIVRNPIEMVYSLHSQFVFDLLETEPDFEKAWTLQDARRHGLHLPRGCNAPSLLQYRDVASFSEQLERYLRVFPSPQIKLLLFDDLVADPRREYESLLRFLELPSDGRTTFEKLNANKILTRSWIKRLDLGVPSRTKAFVRSLKELLGLGARQLLAPAYTRSRRREELPPDLRKRLQEGFDDEVARMSQLVGRDLSHWLSSDGSRNRGTDR